jgi:UDPglucose 6-dehydrogenase
MSESINVVVLGLWHLGCVTAACCSKHFQVIGLDFDRTIISNLENGRAPISEPGLDDLISSSLARGSIRFSADPASACVAADVLWICYDTPVNDADESDVAFVLEQSRRALPHLAGGTLVLISAQLPVGTCAKLEAEFPQLHFACSPENLRLGKAIDAFEKADRVIVGIRSDARRALLEQLFKPFTQRVLFMRTESAEMVKHALNSFLALSVTFINEIARVCEQVGADAQEVATGLKSEPRIGPRAYLGPGGPFAGGTLARDVVTLTRLGEQTGEALALIPAIKASNDQHRGWALRRLRQVLGTLSGQSVAVLGLVYTPNTNTLRRSAAVELCRALASEGASVRAFDPAIRALPPELSATSLCISAADALAGASAAVVCTEWPAFRELNWSALAEQMARPVVIDPNRFLEKPLQGIAGLQHISVGRK